ncbi:fumarylacetoacetate hydrolase family protein [Pseudogracilibacillus sp. SO30301A]|uniref:fumarylacetoacetate hydrolase family protein n=1 Tax=Pseudogracilibacillus sp. SO30301A TaxID=3098291 RepID=UPI00300E1939
MRFVTFRNPQGEIRAGLLVGNGVIDLHLASNGEVPNSMLMFLQKQEQYTKVINRMKLLEKDANFTLDEVQLQAPLPNPTSFRDYMAFEKHVDNSRKKIGAQVPEQWYTIPVFYFSNHHVMLGPNAEVKVPNKTNNLDFELEIACVIGKQGINIKAEEADDYIFGFTILNDFSARDLQGQEMSVGLGPAKGKDFATAIGPYIVTKDEIKQFKSGKSYDLEMKASVNGKRYTSGNWNEIYYSFGEMIERASDSVTLYPGDIIGSGTVGWGCIAELPEDEQRWLQPDDVVELEVQQLGKLKNLIV